MIAFTRRAETSWSDRRRGSFSVPSLLWNSCRRAVWSETGAPSALSIFSNARSTRAHSGGTSLTGAVTPIHSTRRRRRSSVRSTPSPAAPSSRSKRSREKPRRARGEPAGIPWRRDLLRAAFVQEWRRAEAAPARPPSSSRERFRRACDVLDGLIHREDEHELATVEEIHELAVGPGPQDVSLRDEKARTGDVGPRRVEAPKRLHDAMQS